MSNNNAGRATSLGKALMAYRGKSCNPINRFKNDQRGSIAVVFAMMSVIMLGVVGGAVDYGRWLAARSKTHNAIDSAVLAGGRVLQLAGMGDAEAKAAADKYYSRNKSGALDIDNTVFSVNNTEITGVTTSFVKTPFLSLMGIDTLPVTITAKAIVAAGGSGGSHVEVAMMLDTTGSMSGDKMVDLKAAAKDLIDIVVWDDQSEYTSRVALAPFSEYVNVGTAYFSAITNKTASGSLNQRTCVKERNSSKRYKDAKPQDGHYFDYYTGSGTCKPYATIMPLTSDKNALKTHIDSFPTTGMTAGHLGTAWAWYLLSPKWGDVWGSAAKGKGYGQITQSADDQSSAVFGDADFQPKLHKIAILMTDGVYNQFYSGDGSTTQARALCDGMKNKNIVVYTVGFAIGVGSTPDLTMQYCATSESHYYNASNGEALKQAFRDIALKISDLRLSE